MDNKERMKKYYENNPGIHYIQNKSWRYGRPDLRQDQNNRYRRKNGAFVRGGNRWSEQDTQLVLSRSMPDSELGILINRSIEAIQIRRWRMNKRCFK
jgi:hypothetical protein